MKRRVVVIAAGVLLLVAVLFGFRRCGRDAAPRFQTAEITRGPVVQAVTATGTLNPVVNVQVGSQVSGNIQKLFADFNSIVKEGEVIAQIDPVVFQANVNQAEGELANARAALGLARLNAQRVQSLVAKQGSTQAELDQATAALRQAEANVKIREGSLAKAQADLDHATIRSPIDGIVISRNVELGQTVAASLQAPVLFTIANDLSQMQINASVAEADVGAVDVDQEVEFTVDAFPARTFRGKVVQVRNAPTTVQNVVTYDTVIGVTNPEGRLKPGMTANVSIVSARRDDVLKVPNAALRFRPPDATPPPTAARPPGGQGRGGRQGGGPPGERRRGPGARGGAPAERTVYVLQGNRPVATTIKTGISDGVATEVIEGLNEGDRVITSMITSAATPRPQANPFGGPGGGRRGF
jgi:HlyD family secretion protein